MIHDSPCLYYLWSVLQVRIPPLSCLHILHSERPKVRCCMTKSHCTFLTSIAFVNLCYSSDKTQPVQWWPKMFCTHFPVVKFISWVKGYNDISDNSLKFYVYAPLIYVQKSTQLISNQLIIHNFQRQLMIFKNKIRVLKYNSPHPREKKFLQSIFSIWACLSSQGI